MGEDECGSVVGWISARAVPCVWMHQEVAVLGCRGMSPQQELCVVGLQDMGPRLRMCGTGLPGKDEQVLSEPWDLEGGRSGSQSGELDRGGYPRARSAP